MIRTLFLLLPFFLPLLALSQGGGDNRGSGTDGQAVRGGMTGREAIYAPSVLYAERALLERDLRERIIAKTFSMPLDSNTEYRYESACDAVAQFLFHSPETERGFQKLFAGYDSLSPETRKAFLEAIYAVEPVKFAGRVRAILNRETNPKLFSICAVYLHRSDTGPGIDNSLKIRLEEKFPGYDTVAILRELQNYLGYNETDLHGGVPDIGKLFAYQRVVGQKIIYSFQRWDRDYPGLAIVQNADGSFVRDAKGKLEVFQQLARSGSDLPYFITDGSTPQGIYSIQGTAVSRTHFIGPTPNLQLIMPNEDSWKRYFHLRDDSLWSGDSLTLYKSLLPAGWREYRPMMEAWNAGKIGRTEIIAHGTTIDPEYFKDKPFYPLTPTMGCLCAEEVWNPATGRLVISDQYSLVSAWYSTPGTPGYLIVVNMDDQRMPVSRQEAEAWVKRFENQNPAGAGF